MEFFGVEKFRDAWLGGLARFAGLLKLPESFSGPFLPLGNHHGQTVLVDVGRRHWIFVLVGSKGPVRTNAVVALAELRHTLPGVLRTVVQAPVHLLSVIVKYKYPTYG